MAGGNHGCCATDYCLVGGRGPAPGTGRDFSIAHRAGEPSGAGPHYSGLPQRAVGLCRGARAMGVTQQTVTRCLERTVELGVLAALDDRARTGRDARITVEARTWLVGLACAKPTQFGYPHELWTTRLLAAHARDHGPRAGHPSLAKLAQGTVCKILAAHEVKPHKSLPSRRRGCVTTWSGVIPSSNQKWPKCFASIVRSRCAGRSRMEPRRSLRSRSSPMTRNPASRCISLDLT
jgi:hypothetical protein